MNIKKDVSIVANLPDYCGITDSENYYNAEIGDILGKI